MFEARKGIWLGLVGSVLLGCATATPVVEAPAAPAAKATGHDEATEAPAGAARAKVAEPPAAAAQPGLPTTCHKDGELCLPPRAFVNRLCKDEYAAAALHLLGKGSPYSRGYVRTREVESVNTRGGPASDTKLVFGEEVLILEHFGNVPGGMQVSGMGGYIVLRWDGTCATLDEGELATSAQGARKHAPFDWKYIDGNVQEALLKDPRVMEARKRQRQECKGVTMGMRSAACVKADDDLGEIIVVAVRGGAELPLPERMP
jgi:hypothetical protein